MLRNKIGKPTQAGSTTESNKTTDSKTQNAPITNVSGLKIPGTMGSGISGMKTPSLIGNKPIVKPPTNIAQFNITQSQGTVPSLSSKQISDVKNPPTRPKQIKTEQQRLAELINKKAAQMKKQYQMINKISSQVGNDKKSYFKEYETKYGHTLKISNKRLNKIGKNSQKQVSNKIEKQNLKGQQEKRDISAIWKVNQWDLKNQVKQHLLQNFKAEKYL